MTSTDDSVPVDEATEPLPEAPAEETPATAAPASPPAEETPVKDANDEPPATPAAAAQSSPPTFGEEAFRSSKLRPSMGTMAITSKNHTLYNMFVQHKIDECIIFIEAILEEENEILCEYALTCRAQIAQEHGDLETAVNCLTRALKNNPTSAQILYQLGRAHYLLGAHNKAMDCFEEAIGLNPNDWKSFLWNAKSIYHAFPESGNENINKAQEKLVKYDRANKNVDIMVLLAKLFAEKGELISAIEVYNRVLKIEPENLDVTAEISLLYLKSNSEKKGFAYLGKALSTDTTHVPSLLAAATVLQANNDFDVALAKYRVAIDKCDYSGPLWNNIGMCMHGKGKLVASISCLKKANYLCPLDGKVLFNLALLHRTMSQYASAYHFISSAINLQNKNVIFIMTVAIILTDLEDFVSARKAYKKALSIDPANILVRLNFSIFEYRRGNVEDARILVDKLNTDNLEKTFEVESINKELKLLRDCLKLQS
uniref:TPR_REGION domain-containing protein n=1 Tax=Panagrellus redivivus TaxID=6233 RepID=A0A7E4VH58_PANRE